ncbi:hypothetical protein Ahy_A06g030681 isoform A [Arachis hypogaea]|uniref:Secreted protein n=1 Tax=Arachis hypogaea TaxID=3818 RepID=A0A445CX64_ARAHY|nr:hypothetical protein Ahy_A06g030681 isoform A [Arachis hypogaea]
MMNIMVVLVGILLLLGLQRPILHHDTSRGLMLHKNNGCIFHGESNQIELRALIVVHGHIFGLAPLCVKNDAVYIICSMKTVLSPMQILQSSLLLPPSNFFFVSSSMALP